MRPICLTTCVALSLFVSCRKSQPTATDAVQPTIVVARPIQREVTEYAQYVGRTDAVNFVELKARVTGYLMKTPFTEGSVVKTGEVLCEIDPRTYQAQLDAAKGQLAANEAKYREAKTENERAKDLYKRDPKAISLKALDQHQAAEDAAAAAVVASKAEVEVYRLNLEFTKVTSPIDGRVGRYQVTVGNVVTENVTTLTTIVSQDPIYVYFNVDEPTMRIALRKLFAGELPTPASGEVKVGMELPDETRFPHIGTVNFADNEVDPSTGTIELRASFDNPANEEGVRLLLPGMFVRVRLPLSRPAPAILVAQQAIGTDQGQKYVYVVDDGDAVQYRRVTLGQLQDDGLRVVTSGIQAGDRVIVSGLQIVHPKMQVKTEETSMPTNKPADSSPAK